MFKQSLMIAAGALALGSIGCGPTDVGDDTDDNKSYFVDGYQDVSAPAPTTDETSCNYAVAEAMAELGMGVDVGRTIPGNTSWQGIRPGEFEPSTISASEFFDCQGLRGIDAIVFDTSQFG